MREFWAPPGLDVKNPLAGTSSLAHTPRLLWDGGTGTVMFGQKVMQTPKEFAGPWVVTTRTRSPSTFSSGWWILCLFETIATKLLCRQDLGSSW